MTETFVLVDEGWLGFQTLALTSQVNYSEREGREELGAIKTDNLFVQEQTKATLREMPVASRSFDKRRLNMWKL